MCNSRFIFFYLPFVDNFRIWQKNLVRFRYLFIFKMVYFHGLCCYLSLFFCGLWKNRNAFLPSIEEKNVSELGSYMGCVTTIVPRRSRYSCLNSFFSMPSFSHDGIAPPRRSRSRLTPSRTAMTISLPTTSPTRKKWKLPAPAPAVPTGSLIGRLGVGLRARVERQRWPRAPARGVGRHRRRDKLSAPEFACRKVRTVCHAWV